MMRNPEAPPIRMLVLTLTGECNFRCRYCYASEQEKRFMSVRTAVEAVRLAEKGGAFFILQFTGGEPLLNFPVIRAAVRYCEDRRLPVRFQIQTNGSLLTRDMVRWMYRHGVAVGVSLDGRPSVNDRLRKSADGVSASAQAGRGIALLREEGIGTGITCVVTEENADALEGIADMAYFYGNVGQLGFDILRRQGRGAGLRAPSGPAMEEALKRTWERARMMSSATGRSLRFSQIDRVRVLAEGKFHGFGHCYAMNGEAAFVDPSGGIYACSSLMGNSDFLLGHVLSGRDPVKTEKVGRFIAEAMECCRICPDFPLCGGGCFSRWYGTGHVERPEAECALKRFFIRKYEERKNREESSV